MTEGIILLDKPPALTSFKALGEIKRRLGTGKVGHAGTLDRFAEGLLVALAGRFTRLSPFAASMDKEYVACVVFGTATDTLDPEGRVVSEGPIPTRERIESSLPHFLGVQAQVPPVFSAIHVNGRRAYMAARKGEAVELPPRQVTIHGIELMQWEPPRGILRITCSKGTYIRSLARDIATRAGTCAYVSGLRRTRIGGFHVDEAKAPDRFDPDRDILPVTRFFDAATGLGRVTLRENWVSRALNGSPLTQDSFEESDLPDGFYGVFTARGDLVSMLEKRGASWLQLAVFPREGRE